MAGQAMTLVCDVFEYGAPFPRWYTCDGDNQPPKLSWSHAPEQTKSFVLTLVDPDAPNGSFTHWVKYDIPAQANEIDKDGVGLSGRNDFQHPGYGGPCPPANHGEHRYFFKLFALDVASLGLDEGATRQQVEEAMQGHVLANAETMGRYERRTA